MIRNSWINKTNQFWKIIIFCLLIMADVFIFFSLIWRINSPVEKKPSLWFLDEVVLALSFVGFAIVALALIWFSIRCPVCRTSVGSLILKTSGAGIWFTTLISLRCCPHCGDNGAGRSNTTQLGAD